MENLNLYVLANELNLVESRRGTIRIPFGRWDFGEKQLGDGRTVYFEQELSKSGAEQIAAKVNAGVAAGEKGVPVYWGHPDVPELAHKYPDKRAKGWIKSASIGPDFLELHVEWLEDNATDGFGWFSPYWGGPAEHLANGRYLKTVNDLTSVALINIPNIQEFRLANERNEAKMKYELPANIIALAARRDALANEANFDESKHPRSDDGKFSSGGGGGGATGGRTVAAQREFDDALKALQDGQRRGWSKEENDKASKRYLRAERKLKEAKELDRRDKVSARPGAPKQPSTIRDSDFRTQPEFVRARPREALIKELAAIYADKRAGRL